MARGEHPDESKLPADWKFGAIQTLVRLRGLNASLRRQARVRVAAISKILLAN